MNRSCSFKEGLCPPDLEIPNLPPSPNWLIRRIQFTSIPFNSINAMCTFIMIYIYTYIHTVYNTHIYMLPIQIHI